MPTPILKSSMVKFLSTVPSLFSSIPMVNLSSSIKVDAIFFEKVNIA